MRLLIAACIAIAAASCSGETPQATPTIPPSPTPTIASELPASVEQTRSAIVQAARARDHDALGALLDPRTFNYSFGENGDPIGYWRKLESEGHVPLLGDIMPAVFATTPAKQGGTYVWPAAAAKDVAEWTEDDVRDLLTFNNEDDIDQYREFGGYIGWRAGIQAEGAWLYFVSGD